MSVAARPGAAVSGARLSGSAVMAAVKEAGIGTIIAVPDITTSEQLLRPISRDPDFRLVRVCKEDEGVGIAVGLAFCRQRAMLLIQSTGLLDSVNALRANAVEYEQPVCFMVGLLPAKEVGVAPRDSVQYGVRIVQRVLDAMEVAHEVIETDDDVVRIAPAIEAAYAGSRPVVLLIGPAAGTFS